MQVFYLQLCVVLLCSLPSFAAADGMVYRLPKDGTWATFAMQGVVLDSDEKTIDSVLNITGTLTIRSVGSVRVNDEPCRWIEIAIDGQRDGKAFKEIDKLLIPEKHIGAGKQPLKHLRDAWYMHSAMEDGKPRRLEEKEKADIAYLQRVRSILHSPFKNVKQGDDVVVDCKLGKVACECVAAEEKEKHPGSDIQYGSSYVICLHQDAPFGVAAWQATNRVHCKGELVGVTKLTMTLVDFGTGAKSSIPVTAHRPMP